MAATMRTIALCRRVTWTFVFRWTLRSSRPLLIYLREAYVAVRKFSHPGVPLQKPYQLEIRMYDYNSGSQHEEIACVVSQLRFAEGK